MAGNLKHILIALLHSAKKPVKLGVDIILLCLATIGLDSDALITILGVLRLCMEYT